MKKSLLVLALLAGCGPGGDSHEDIPVSSDPNAPPKVKVISQGGKYRPEDYLVPGYVTILDIYADWCGPCKRITPTLYDLVRKNDKVILRKVNIVSWDTEAWKQAHIEYRANGIPLIAVFDVKGNSLGQVRADPESLEAAVKRALQP